MPIITPGPVVIKDPSHLSLIYSVLPTRILQQHTPPITNLTCQHSTQEDIQQWAKSTAVRNVRGPAGQIVLQVTTTRRTHPIILVRRKKRFLLLPEQCHLRYCLPANDVNDPSVRPTIPDTLRLLVVTAGPCLLLLLLLCRLRFCPICRDLRRVNYSWTTTTMAGTRKRSPSRYKQPTLVLWSIAMSGMTTTTTTFPNNHNNNNNTRLVVVPTAS